MAACDRTGRRAGCEEAVHAGGAHCVVAFWIDEKGEAWVQVPVGFADGADVGCWIGGNIAESRTARHFRCRDLTQPDKWK